MLHVCSGPVLGWLCVHARLRDNAGYPGSQGLCSADSAGQVP